MLIFGEKAAGTYYPERSACYAVIVRNDLFMAVRNPRGDYFLPGGGIEDGETDLQCLKRELLEETGYEFSDSEKIGEAGRYFFTSRRTPLFNKGYFYEVMLGDQIQEPIEVDHETVWLDDPADLFHDHHTWAVRRVMEGANK